MRQLVLLRGAPGSGKSTFIKNNNLRDWTISADEIRLLFQSPVTTPDGGKEISQKNDNRVWEFIYDILEERMKRGEFVIVDATHSRMQWVSRYKELVERYRYRVYGVEFMPSLGTVLSQNKTRPSLKFVPEEYVEKSYNFILTDKLSGWIKKITKEELLDMASKEMKPMDYNQYSKIHHIGDLHGCYTVFKEYFDMVGGLKEDEMWVFVGDYIDRGIENGLLLKFLIENFMGKKNVLFLEGNHEKWLRNWSHGEANKIKSREFLLRTVPDIQSQNIEMSDIRGFTRRIGQIAWYEYAGMNVLVNHCGFPNVPSSLVTTDEFVNGVGKYDDILTIHETWNKSTPNNYYQIHGHRNMDKNPIRNNRCFNLTNEIEFGGDFRAVQLTRSGFEEFSLINTVFNPKENLNTNINPISISAENKEDILKKLLSDNNVTKKKLGENVVSFNFNRDVFYNKKWNSITTKARGLFVNVNTGKIVSRSWDKFFNIDERDETKYAALKRNLKFPLNVYLKENGFLGLIGYNDENNSIFVSSKSVNNGDFVDMFKNILQEKNVDMEKVRNFVKLGYTLVFEVIDIYNDPHIIKYPENDIYLLNVVKNDFSYNAMEYSEIKDVARILGVKVKEKIGEISSWIEFSDWYNQVEKNLNHKYYGNYVEGFVVEDSSGFMFKIKTEFYKFWKKMRGVKDALQKGRRYNTAWLQTPEEVLVYDFIKNGFTRDELSSMSIIDIQQKYLRSKGE